MTSSFQHRQRRPLIWALAFLALARWAPADTVGDPASAAPAEITVAWVDRLLAEAQGRSPAIAAAGARAEAATAAVGGVRTWEDPVFTIGLALPTARGTKSSEDGNILYGVEQKLPVFGRPRLAREAAEAEAAQEKLGVAYETQKLRRDLRVALVELALADESVDLARQDLGWLEMTQAAVDQRYRVGKTSQVEWLKAQTERAQARDRLKTLVLQREHRQVGVNRLLNRDLNAPWPAVALPAASPPLVDDAALIAAAEEADPRLQVLRQDITRAETMARVTRQRRQPDIGIGVQGRNYSGDGGLREGLVTVSFTLPWLNARRYDQDFQRDRARMRASEFESADYALALRESLHRALIDLDAARRQVRLYRDELIPLTEQTLASARTAWENNLGRLQDLLEARRLLVDNRLVLAQALAEQGRLQAELCFRTGRADLAPFVRSPSASESTP
jgi:outer membrane protein TolC